MVDQRIELRIRRRRWRREGGGGREGKRKTTAMPPQYVVPGTWRWRRRGSRQDVETQQSQGRGLSIDEGATSCSPGTSHRGSGGSAGRADSAVMQTQMSRQASIRQTRMLIGIP